VEGDIYSAYANNTMILQVQDATSSSGLAGLAGVYGFDNFEVSELN